MNRPYMPDDAEPPSVVTDRLPTKHPRRVRRLLARKTKHQLAEVLTPHHPDKWEQR